MKTIYLIFFSLVLWSTSYGQILPTKLNKRDSIELHSAWIRFRKALAFKNSQKVRDLSLKSIDCDLFQDPDPRKGIPYNSFISINDFINQFWHQVPDSKLWDVVNNRSYRFWKTTQFQPHNVKHSKRKALIIYQIWFTVWEPNELQKGDEGQSDAFGFVKINGAFKFYGMTSIP